MLVLDKAPPLTRAHGVRFLDTCAAPSPVAEVIQTKFEDSVVSFLAAVCEVVRML